MTKSNYSHCFSFLHCASKKCTNFCDLCRQEAWIKFIQFCCKASKCFRKLCPCFMFKFTCPFMLSYLSTNDLKTSRFSSVCTVRCLPLPRHLSTVLYFLIFTSNLLFVQSLWKLCHELPSIISLLFIRSFNQNFACLLNGAIVYKQSDD